MSNKSKSKWIVENDFWPLYIDRQGMPVKRFRFARAFPSFESANALAEHIDPTGLRGWRARKYPESYRG